MAETAITAVLSKFGELASREAAVLLQVGDDIMLLRDRLEWLQAFIRDADRKRRVGADDLTRVWVRQTRDVAFEAEDALDEFFHKVDLESQGFRGWRIWQGYLASFMTQISIRHGLSGQIKRIKSRLDQISENQKEYNIEHTPSGIWTPATTAHVTWDDLQTVVGFEEDVKSLKKLLLYGDDSPKMFISILGESGVGKNTLVKKIYKDRDVRKTFRLLIAYSMPPDSSTEDLLKQVYNIACKLSDEHGASSQEEGTDIADKLRRLLANKKYLLILGGISSKTIVNCIAASLPDDGEGSRVVLTLEPESKEVACHAANLNVKVWHAANLNVKGVKSVHQLSRLDEERSGRLFRLRVFGSERDEMKGSAKEKDQKKGSAKEKEMERYEKDVYNITGGHPLAIVVLAGLLRSKEKPVEWDAVLQQLKPGMEEAQDGQLSKDKPVVEWEALQLLQQIMSPPAAREPAKLSNRMAIERIFSSSFDDLPQDLKSCFLYFAAYPKDITHHADQIVRMWTAEGFIRPQKGKTMEQLGHSYLKELVSRCLVELEEKNCSGDIKLVRVHNRILVFLQSEAREASFIEVHDRNDVLAPASVRRLSIQNDSGSYTTFTNKFPKLRSFICRVEEEVQSGGSAGQDKKQGQSSGSGSACQDKKQGQSSGSGSAGQDKKQGQSSGSGSAGQDKKQGQSSQNYDIKFLCGSKFLRVLSVQGLNLTELPDEIGDMIHLRYLRVDCTHLKKLPCSIGKLLNLQTLDISKTSVEEIDKEFWLIKALRHVLANNLTLPVSVEMQELGELQTLHGVKLAQDKNDAQPCCVFSKTTKPAQGKKEEGSSPLDKMTKLRSLEMHGFKHEDAAALKSALGKMHLLGHLKLKGDGIPSCVFTEPSLRCLQTMVLVGTVECLESAALDIRKARPNLVSLKVKDNSDVPQEIIDELKKMNIKPEILTSE